AGAQPVSSGGAPSGDGGERDAEGAWVESRRCQSVHLSSGQRAAAGEGEGAARYRVVAHVQSDRTVREYLLLLAPADIGCGGAGGPRESRRSGLPGNDRRRVDLGHRLDPLVTQPPSPHRGRGCGRGAVLSLRTPSVIASRAKQSRFVYWVLLIS